MSTKVQLLNRLDAIGRALKQTGQGLALLGLGSVGQELDRLDDFSDLDFFVITKPGCKQQFLESLAWLETIQPVAFSFQNTADGHKILFADGIFCETAVFEAEELAGIPYTGARVVWQDEHNTHAFPTDNRLPETHAKPPTVEWLVGEILSNLYVGLGRYRRGERLTAARFIQGYAIDRLLELAPIIEEEQASIADPFDSHRRFEQRYPKIAAQLPFFLPGYQKSPQAASAILDFLQHHFAINTAMKEAIFSLSRSGRAA